jgi:hypothetical protein
VYRDLREKRIGIEMVKDSVELGLQTEAEIIHHHQEILRSILTEVMQHHRWPSLTQISTS